VKIRGHRIELGEIEAALLSQPDVKVCAVVVREERPGDKRLVAYVVPLAGQSASIPSLQEHLRRRLPEYMVPSVFLVLSELPLTESGKVDRKALPAPDTARPDLESTYAAPRTPTEEQLAGLWAEILGLDQVGVSDDFFSLGGHSLLATRLLSRIQASFQVELSLRTFLGAPTVASLAVAIDRSRAAGDARAGAPSSALPVIVPEPSGRFEPFPLTDIQYAYWMGRREDFELGGVATHAYVEVEGADIDVERFNLALQ
jgi:hypothetical protein